MFVDAVAVIAAIIIGGGGGDNYKGSSFGNNCGDPKISSLR